MLKKFVLVLSVLCLLSHVACKSQQGGGGVGGDRPNGQPQGQGEGGQPTLSKQQGSVTEEGLEDNRAQGAPGIGQSGGPGLGSNGGAAFSGAGLDGGLPFGVPGGQIGPPVGPAGASQLGDGAPGLPDQAGAQQAGAPSSGAGIGSANQSSTGTADAHAGDPTDDPAVQDTTRRSRPVADGSPTSRVGETETGAGEEETSSERVEATTEEGATETASDTPSKAEEPAAETSAASTESGANNTTLSEFNVPPDTDSWLEGEADGTKPEEEETKKEESATE